MADKQALNATFFAFRRRDRGGVLLGASVAFLIVAVVLGGAFFLLNAQGMMDYINWATHMGAGIEGGKPGEAPSMANMMPPASVMSLMPAYFLFMLAYYVLMASYEAACLRWMIHGETGGLFGLSLGADTWRVYFGYWLWFFLLMAFYFVFAILAGGAALSIMAMGQGNMNAPAATVAIPLLLGLLLCIGLIYFGVRFAPAAATSIARRRFAFFDAWTVSKGRFWALFGAYLLLMVMFFVFYIIAAAGVGFAAASMAINQAGGQPQTPEEAFRAFANPQWFAVIGSFVAVMVLASMTLYVALFGVNARAAVAALEEGKIKPAG